MLLYGFGVIAVLQFLLAKVMQKMGGLGEATTIFDERLLFVNPYNLVTAVVFAIADGFHPIAGE